jgi:uncharacterized protein YdiU (UPF0061 family)
MGTRKLKSLEELTYRNRFETELGDAFFSRVLPTPALEPALAAVSPEALSLLELAPGEASRPEFLALIGGASQLKGLSPLAQLYSGHQFGVYVPQLGDGRAILLAEVETSDGALWDLHLKGAGQTPYSRMGDGRAVLRSCIREFLASEAMAALSIPTSRALGIAVSREPVFREQTEPRALLLRLAPSHLRFGTFQIHAHRNHPERVEKLLRYALRHCLKQELGLPYEEFIEQPLELQAARFFEIVTLLTAQLIAEWQAVGFQHGVMNTDNLSIHGITLDYGPYGFMEQTDPSWICNHSDHSGRYAFDQQPRIGLWNLQQLGGALLCLAPENLLVDALKTYEPTFYAHFMEKMRAKLGLSSERSEDLELVSELLLALTEAGLDYTVFFRSLGQAAESPESLTWEALLRGQQTSSHECQGQRLAEWTSKYRQRLDSDPPDPQRRSNMERANPKFILRNYLAEIAIRKAYDEGDYSEIETLRRILSRPFDEQPQFEAYASPPPDWGKKLEISCSS